jgi:hypothetical protein
MSAESLVSRLMQYSHQLHSQYSREQHWAWISSVLASVVLEKNHMDNIVLARLNARLDSLLS